MEYSIENPLSDKWEKRYNTLNEETKQKLEKLDEMDPKDYQLKVIKRIKLEIKDGDVFVLSPAKGIYFYGKVLKANIEHIEKSPFIQGKHLIFIFKGTTDEMNMGKFSPNYNDLLIAPAIVDISYWNKGYFFNIGNEEITEEEKNLDYGFLYIHFKGNSYCKENGMQIEKPKILGMFGITTLIGIADEIQKELIIEPGLIK